MPVEYSNAFSICFIFKYFEFASLFNKTCLQFIGLFCFVLSLSRKSLPSSWNILCGRHISWEKFSDFPAVFQSKLLELGIGLLHSFALTLNTNSNPFLLRKSTKKRPLCPSHWHLWTSRFPDFSTVFSSKLCELLIGLLQSFTPTLNANSNAFF
jgi:hypothetical protein